ncbi:MAG: 50S ribosomal protein L3 [Acidobacteria bacterium]|nr:50S ribosomal protein L3 [Acidobacteriota bacterium]
MIKGLIGKKVGMTQVHDEQGRVVPVTVLEVGPCVVTQVKTSEHDGYNAVQVGLVEENTPRKLSKAEVGHLGKSQIAPMRHLREFRLNEASDAKVGDQLSATVFEKTDKLTVTGTSRGKGFQGVIRRHGFGGGRMTHGSNFKRAPGSIGQCATPSRVFPGKKMPGQMGNKRVTVRNLEVVEIIEDKNLILVKGAVPGSKGGIVTIRKS